MSLFVRVYLSGCVFEALDVELPVGHLCSKICFIGNGTSQQPAACRPPEQVFVYRFKFEGTSNETGPEVGQMLRQSGPFAAVTMATRCSHRTSVTLLILQQPERKRLCLAKKVYLVSISLCPSLKTLKALKHLQPPLMDFCSTFSSFSSFITLPREMLLHFTEAISVLFTPSAMQHTTDPLRHDRYLNMLLRVFYHFFSCLLNSSSDIVFVCLCVLSL